MHTFTTTTKIDTRRQARHYTLMEQQQQSVINLILKWDRERERKKTEREGNKIYIIHLNSFTKAHFNRGNYQF